MAGPHRRRQRSPLLRAALLGALVGLTSSLKNVFRPPVDHATIAFGGDVAGRTGIPETFASLTIDTAALHHNFTFMNGFLSNLLRPWSPGMMRIGGRAAAALTLRPIYNSTHTNALPRDAPWNRYWEPGTEPHSNREVAINRQTLYEMADFAKRQNLQLVLAFNGVKHRNESLGVWDGGVNASAIVYHLRTSYKARFYKSVVLGNTTVYAAEGTNTTTLAAVLNVTGNYSSTSSGSTGSGASSPSPAASASPVSEHPEALLADPAEYLNMGGGLFISDAIDTRFIGGFQLEYGHGLNSELLSAGMSLGAARGNAEVLAVLGADLVAGDAAALRRFMLDNLGPNSPVTGYQPTPEEAAAARRRLELEVRTARLLAGDRAAAAAETDSSSANSNLPSPRRLASTSELSYNYASDRGYAVTSQDGSGNATGNGTKAFNQGPTLVFSPTLTDKDIENHPSQVVAFIKALVYSNILGANTSAPVLSPASGGAVPAEGTAPAVPTAAPKPVTDGGATAPNYAPPGTAPGAGPATIGYNASAPVQTPRMALALGLEPLIPFPNNSTCRMYDAMDVSNILRLRRMLRKYMKVLKAVVEGDDPFEVLAVERTRDAVDINGPSPTPSRTPSVSISPSASISLNPTSSPSHTVSPSTTPSASLSNSLTPSRTGSRSITPTVTGSGAVSGTPSGSATASKSGSAAASATASASDVTLLAGAMSGLPGSSEAPSASVSASASSSASGTPSGSPSASASGSLTPSASASESPSSSASSSVSVTPSATPSFSPSSSSSPSLSTVPTASATMSTPPTIAPTQDVPQPSPAPPNPFVASQWLPVVLSEVASGSRGGCAGITDRFVSGFYFLEALAIAAEAGLDAVFRDAFAGYAGIDTLNYNPVLGPADFASGVAPPHADFFTGILWRQLVGATALHQADDPFELLPKINTTGNHYSRADFSAHVFCARRYSNYSHANHTTPVSPFSVASGNRSIEKLMKATNYFSQPIPAAAMADPEISGYPFVDPSKPGEVVVVYVNYGDAVWLSSDMVTGSGATKRRVSTTPRTEFILTPGKLDFIDHEISFSRDVYDANLTTAVLRERFNSFPEEFFAPMDAVTLSHVPYQDMFSDPSHPNDTSRFVNFVDKKTKTVVGLLPETVQYVWAEGKGWSAFTYSDAFNGTVNDDTVRSPSIIINGTRTLLNLTRFSGNTPAAADVPSLVDENLQELLKQFFPDGNPNIAVPAAIEQGPNRTASSDLLSESVKRHYRLLAGVPVAQNVSRQPVHAHSGYRQTERGWEKVAHQTKSYLDITVDLSIITRFFDSKGYPVDPVALAKYAGLNVTDNRIAVRDVVELLNATTSTQLDDWITNNATDMVKPMSANLTEFANQFGIKTDVNKLLTKWNRTDIVARRQQLFKKYSRLGKIMNREIKPFAPKPKFNPPSREERYLNKGASVTVGSDAIALNGRPLRVDAHGRLKEAPLRGRFVDNPDMPLILPGNSYGFLVLHAAEVPACIDNEPIVGYLAPQYPGAAIQPFFSDTVGDNGTVPLTFTSTTGSGGSGSASSAGQTGTTGGAATVTPTPTVSPTPSATGSASPTASPPAAGGGIVGGADDRRLSDAERAARAGGPGGGPGGFVRFEDVGARQHSSLEALKARARARAAAARPKHAPGENLARDGSEMLLPEEEEPEQTGAAARRARRRA